MLNFDSLQATHGLDSAITEGTEIVLKTNPDYKFLVRVPSEYNKAFRGALAASLDMYYDEDGQVAMKSNLVEFRQKQMEAFFKHCLVSINGEPVPDDFIDRFPKVLEELLVEATTLAAAIDEEVEDAVKK